MQCGETATGEGVHLVQQAGCQKIKKNQSGKADTYCTTTTRYKLGIPLILVAYKITVFTSSPDTHTNKTGITAHCRQSSQSPSPLRVAPFSQSRGVPWPQSSTHFLGSDILRLSANIEKRSQVIRTETAKAAFLAARQTP